MCLKANKGFTLVELIVVMAIFMAVIIVTASTFKTVVGQMGNQSKSMETQIEGIVGLEVLRADLEQCGFGLPWSFQKYPSASVWNYNEVNVGSTIPAPFWPGSTSPNSFNDAPGNPPRAVQNGDTTFNQGGDPKGSQYLVLKSTLAATNNSAKRWTSAVYSASDKKVSQWDTADRNLVDSDRVIVLRTTFSNGIPQRQLQVVNNRFFNTFSQFTTLSSQHTDGDVFQIYGVDSGDLKMPFNRADYYVRAPGKMPADCAPHTGVLYKATANQNGPGFLEIPLLDCVADMQVVYGRDSLNKGLIDDYQENLTGYTAQQIREQVKEIRVYILAQEGKRDSGFQYPSPTFQVGETLLGVFRGRNFNLAGIIGATEYRNYRWKLYTIVVRPKNLIQ